jgi:hypothetical protein
LIEFAAGRDKVNIPFVAGEVTEHTKEKTTSLLFLDRHCEVIVAPVRGIGDPEESFNST